MLTEEISLFCLRLTKHIGSVLKTAQQQQMNGIESHRIEPMK